MDSEHQRSSEKELLLDEVVTDYMESRERGEAPDRREWLARYPELSADLQKFFADDDEIKGLTGALREIARSADGHQAFSGRECSPAPLCSFGDYELLEEIGHGGMGVVYKAQQISLKRVVALKMILAGKYASDEELARFRTEAEVLARLQHPSVLQIYEIGQRDGWPYLCLEFAGGGSLSERLSAGPWAPRQAAELVKTLARAMHAVHQHGVIHRDLKPANVLLTHDGAPKITDFGLAKLLQVGSDFTRSGVIVGTPSYMAPEQTSGRPAAVTTVTDVYGLGAILYAVLTGRPPFQGNSPLETLSQVKDRKPAQPIASGLGLDLDLQTICLKCLEKEPARRYGSAEALADDLDRWLAGKPILARPIASWEHGWRWCRRNPAPALLGAIALLLLIITVASLAVSERRTRGALRWAEANYQTAQKQRIVAEERELAARRYLYAAHMHLAQQAWEERHVARGLELLESHRPEPGEEDLRSFDWYYLWRLYHGGNVWTVKAPAPVNRLAFSPDESILVGALADGHLRLWELSTGRELAASTPQAANMTSVALSPDGKTVASVSEDGALRLSDVPSGRERMRLTGGRSLPRALAFSQGGLLLAAASSHGTVQLFDAFSGQVRAILQGHQGAITCLAFARDGHIMASGGEVNRVRVWDLADSTEQIALAGHKGVIMSLDFSPDAALLASASDDWTVKLWDLGARRQRVSFEKHRGGVTAVAFAPDGTTLASGGVDGAIRLWNAASGVEQAPPRGHADLVQCVAFAPDGTHLASASADRTVKLWQVAPRPEVDTLRVPKYRDHARAFHHALCFSPDGKLLAWGSEDGEVGLVDPASGRDRLLTTGQTTGVSALAFAPNGTTLATGSPDGSVKLWNVPTLACAGSLNAEASPVWSLAFNPVGPTLAAGTQNGGVLLWNVGTKRLDVVLKQSAARINMATFSPDGHMLISAGDDGRVCLWNLARKEPRSSLDVGLQPAYAAVFAPDGRTAAVVARTWGVDLWEPATGRSRTFKGHAGGIYAAVAFCPDGRTLATGSVDGTVKLWDLATGQERLTLKGGDHHIHALAFSPDATILATWCCRGTIRLWRGAPVGDAR
jgi:WD40 repeat protein